MNVADLKAKFLKIYPNFKKFRLWFFILLVLFFLGENILLLINSLNTNKPIIGLKFQNQTLGFKNQNQIEALITSKIETAQKGLILKTPQASSKITPNDIGLKFDLQNLTNLILQKGRTGNLFSKILTQNMALLGTVNIPLQGKINKTLLGIKVLSIADDLNIPAAPQMPDFQNNMNATIAKRDGQKIDAKKLTSAIVSNIYNPPNIPIDIPIVSITTNYSDVELIPIRAQAIALTKLPLSINSGGQTLTFSPTDLKSILTVVERPDPKNPQSKILQLRLNDEKLDQKLAAFAAQVEAKNHTEFDYEDARVLVFSQFYANKRFLAQVPTGQPIKVLAAENNTNGPKIAYLTFDDGPNAIYHPLILDILKTYQAKATFFLIGNNVKNNPDITQRTEDEGHIIGNHSLTHPFLPNLSNSAIVNELAQTDKILLPYLTKQQLTLFRPPYGGVNSYVYKDSADLGLKLTLWDVDPRDWSEPSTDVLINRVISATHAGSDILMHSNHLATVKALPKIIEVLKQEGYVFNTLQ